MDQLSQFVGAKVEAQKVFFASGATLPIAFRMEQLRKLADALHEWEAPLCNALKKDLNKSYQEAMLTEISIVQAEIRNHLRHLRRWARPKRVATPLKLTPSRSRVITQPLGTALIIAPWNYPVQLLLNPLVGAISAGCTAVLKTSPAVPNVAQVLVQMIGCTFPENYITLFNGHRDMNTALLEQHYDLIFFTGSPALGHTVMEAAAQHLTPVVLELGGKSPTIVDRGADIEVAAKRIAWGKSINAGQTCIAPDYLLIHSSLKERFTTAFTKAIEELHGSDVAQSEHYGRMVSTKAFERVAGYLAEGKILSGGHTDASSRYIEPTLMEVANGYGRVMQEEIFGPILPLLSYDDIEEVVEFITERPRPLALYYFGHPREGKKLLPRLISGGACINDTIMHIANEDMPFGGVGNSGMGRYHGYESFLCFSHRRAVLTTPRHLDLPFRYMPYRLWGLIKRLM